MKKLLYILLFVPLALFGQDNYSLSFDGVDDYVDLGEDLFSSNEGTISARVKYNNSINQYHPIFSQTDIDVQGNYLRLAIQEDSALFVHDYRQCTGFPGYLNFPHASSLINLNENEWVDISVTSDGFNWKIYINGFEYQYDISGNDSQSGKWFEDLCDGIKKNYIGRWKRSMSDEFFNGLINQIQVWDKSLTQEEIQFYITCPPTGNEEGLVGYWNFNEGSGNTVYDLSGNGNNGLINGGATYSEDVPEQNCSSSDEPSIIDQLNQSFDVWNITIDLSAGWNMFGYGCPESYGVAEGLSNHTESIIITKDNNGNVYMPEFGFNGIGSFTPGFGYQIKLTEAIQGFSLCDWYVNDIPEDNIVSLQEENLSLQDSIENLNNEILELECVNQGACFFNNQLNECDYPQEGYNCNGNFILQIGDEAFGGIVFYIDETSHHGLVSSMDDIEGTYEWGCHGTGISGADGQSIGTGYQNTLDIVSGCSETPVAASEALAYESEGYSDWYLPSYMELTEMYSSISNEISQNGFTSNWYWSSSEYNGNKAWNVNFTPGSGISDGSIKNYPINVRPIRAFGNWIEGCMDETACNFNPEANMADGSCIYAEQGYDCDGIIQIGTIAYGGIVFYVDETGQYGLVVALNDIGEVAWGCQGIDINGAEESFIGYGYQNTLDIINNCDEDDIAARLCSDYISESYEDWYLPSIDELILIYNNIGFGAENIGGFQPGNYWSSTEYNEESAMEYFMGENNSYQNSDKENSDYVRPIRAFGNWTMGCMDSLACNYNPDANMADGSCIYPEQGYDCEGNINVQVGEVAFGGIVFYVAETGQHGLVVAMEDIEGTYVWGCHGTSVNGADNISIGTGYQNTMDIVNQGCTSEAHPFIAAQAALDSQINFYNDWYLPSNDELIEIYNTIGNESTEDNIGVFETDNNTYYWSSSEADDDHAWSVRFSNGYINDEGKDSPGRVRPIRSF